MFLLLDSDIVRAANRIRHRGDPPTSGQKFLAVKKSNIPHDIKYNWEQVLLNEMNKEDDEKRAEDPAIGVAQNQSTQHPDIGEVQDETTDPEQESSRWRYWNGTLKHTKYETRFCVSADGSWSYKPFKPCKLSSELDRNQRKQLGCKVLQKLDGGNVVIVQLVPFSHYCFVSKCVSLNKLFFLTNFVIFQTTLTI